MGWSEGEVCWRWRWVWKDTAAILNLISPLNKEINDFPTVCAAEWGWGVSRRGGRWKQIIGEKQKKSRGVDLTQEKKKEKKMCREWNVSWHFYLSITRIEVHFPNGHFTKWTRAVLISQGRLLCSKQFTFRQKWTLLLSLCLLQFTFHCYHCSLSFVSVGPLHHPSLSLQRFSYGCRNSIAGIKILHFFSIIYAALFFSPPKAEAMSCR